MGDEHRELANRLFANAKTMLEDMIEVAVAGPSLRQTPWQLAKNGRRLEAAARDVVVVAQAATIIANLGLDRSRTRRKSRR